MQGVITSIMSLVGVVIGAYAVYLASSKQAAARRRAEFRDKQLFELYGPIAVRHRRIAAYEQFRRRVMFSELSATDPSDFAGPLRDLPAWAKYDVEHLQSVIRPLYREILNAFTNWYGLADADTREHYVTVVEAVELHERSAANGMSLSTLLELAPIEIYLEPFFEHVDGKVERLQAEIVERPRRLTPRWN
jgi:hypothetical protein